MANLEELEKENIKLKKALICYACECDEERVYYCRRYDNDNCGWLAKECFGGTRESVREARRTLLYS